MSTLLSYVPLLSGSLLVITGILIVVEIYYMVRKDPEEKKQNVIKASEEPITQPLQFPQVTAPKKLSQQKVAFSVTRISPRQIIAGIALLALVGGIVYSFQSGFVNNALSFTKDIFSSPTPNELSTLDTTDIDAQLLLYRETPENEWQPIGESDLSLLTSGDIIKIAVHTSMHSGRIVITVNGETVPLQPDRTPNGDIYALYRIPVSESTYNVAAQIY